MAKSTTTVFSGRTQTCVGIGSLIVFAGLICWALINPAHFYDPIARSALNLAGGVFIGMFLFILYPADYDIDVAKVIHLPIKARIVGPAALCVIWICVFDYYVPHAAGARVFTLAYDDSAIKSAVPVSHSSSLTSFTTQSGDTSIIPLPDTNSPSFELKRVLVEFPAGKGQVTADATMEYNGHNYVAKNLRFSLAAPKNQIVVHWIDEAQKEERK